MDERALGKRWVKCGGTVRAGMRGWQTDDYEEAIYCTLVDVYICVGGELCTSYAFKDSYDTQRGYANKFVPDFSSGATRGEALEDVREAWGDCLAYSESFGGTWRVWIRGGRRCAAGTEAESLVVAREAAPSSPG